MSLSISTTSKNISDEYSQELLELAKLLQKRAIHKTAKTISDLTGDKPTLRIQRVLHKQIKNQKE